MPHGPRLGPVWEQSTEYLDPGPQQASDFAAPLPRGTTFYQLQAWAPSSKSGRKVLGAQQRVLSWMGTHSVVMAGMGPPTRPPWEWAGPGDPLLPGAFHGGLQDLDSGPRQESLRDVATASRPASLSEGRLWTAFAPKFGKAG